MLLQCFNLIPFLQFKHPLLNNHPYSNITIYIQSVHLAKLKSRTLNCNKLTKEKQDLFFFLDQKPKKDYQYC